MISIRHKVLWCAVGAGLLGAWALKAVADANAHQSGNADTSARRRGVPRRHAASARMLTAAAKAFVATLDEAARTRAVLSMDSEERLNWNYVPAARQGLSLKAMNEVQRAAATRLLRAALSAGGWRKVETIRSLESVLYAAEGNNPTRDSGLYYLTIFGAPSPTQPWALRYEGHHISLNWTMVAGQVIADSPQFLGANPARVLQGPLQGTRALAPEEDLGRALIASLNEAQKKVAVLSAAAPPEILTGTQRTAAIQENTGIAYTSLSTTQRALLISLIQQHAAVQPPSVARQRLTRLRNAGLNDIKFAWMGGLQPGQGHYYRVQGPTFLIEYDNTQNDANHIHTVWRDFHRDFGADLLGQHLHDTPHNH